MSVQNEERILGICDDEAHISSRHVSQRTGISQASVHCVIRRNLLHPYRIQNEHELLQEDFS